ncbi:MAG: tyrosine-protein phosphatase [Clostridia bacterium]
MLDMHCHIVPYTDDGALDTYSSIEMGKKAQEIGYTGIIATSHYIIHDSELVNKEYVNNIEKLNELFRLENIELEVYAGNEVFFTNNLINLVKEKKVCTLADSRYILVELPLFNNIVPMNVYEEFNKLQDEGYIPILAHPERYDFVTKDINNLLPLIESGVLIQSNIGSISGKYGKNAKKNVKKMLKRNMVHFLGTDSHNTTVYDIYEKCIKLIKKTIKNEEIYNKIMIDNPNKVLSDEKIDIWYPKSK